MNAICRLRPSWRLSNYFRGIEAYVCQRCGEEAYSAEDIEMMESLIEGTLKDESSPKLMNVQEVSSFLRVTPQTIYNMLRGGCIKATKVGREWRFSREAVMEVFGFSSGFGPAFYRAESVNERIKEYHAEAPPKIIGNKRKNDEPFDPAHSTNEGRSTL